MTAISTAGRPTAEPSPDILIIGGGVIGTATAYYLARAGMSVLLIERDSLAAGASGVAAGMLAPQVEAPFDDPFFNLTLLGRAEHPPLAAALFEEVGLDVEYRPTGILRIALDEADRAELQRRLRWQSARGLRAEWLEPDRLGEREPLLAGAAGRLLAGGLWLPDEGQVRGTRLVQALAVASVKRGARLRQGEWAVSFETRGDRVVGVRTPRGLLKAATFVLAAGIWSRDLAGSLPLSLPVGPVKGQVLMLRALHGAPRHIIWTGECYLVPKADGQVILGATEEDGNYDARPTLAGVGSLAEAALEHLPWAGSFTVEGMWAGLRPAAPDRYPIIGQAPGFANLIIATAHFRNGILLGPLTGRWIADYIQTGAWAPELAAFSPARFLEPARDGSV